MVCVVGMQLESPSLGNSWRGFSIYFSALSIAKGVLGPPRFFYTCFVPAHLAPFLAPFLVHLVFKVQKVAILLFALL